MNEVGNVINNTDEGKAKYDAALKELLSNKQFLARIMKRFIKEFANYPLEDIENKYIEVGDNSVSGVGIERNTTNIEGVCNEDTSLNEVRIVYDIIFKAYYPDDKGKYIGMYINVEAQNAYYQGYPVEMRGTYYAARKLSSQLRSLNDGTNYGALQKVYSIWICMGNVPNFEANTATLYRAEKCDVIGTVNRSEREYDLINVVILRINDKIESEDDILRLLQVLCSNVIEKNKKLKILQDYGIRIDDEVEEGVSNMCNLSDLVEMRAIEKGMERGIEKGIEEGKEETAINLLKEGINVDVILKATGISKERLQVLIDNSQRSELREI